MDLPVFVRLEDVQDAEHGQQTSCDQPHTPGVHDRTEHEDTEQFPAAQSPRSSGRPGRSREVLDDGHSFPPRFKGLRHWQCSKVGQDMAHCGDRAGHLGADPRGCSKVGQDMAHCGISAPSARSRSSRDARWAGTRLTAVGVLTTGFDAPCTVLQGGLEQGSLRDLPGAIVPNRGPCSNVGQEMAHCGRR